MAPERVRALVRRISLWPDVHVAASSETSPGPGQVWVEKDNRGLWLVRVLRCPFPKKADASGQLIRPAQPEDFRAHEEGQALANQLLAEAQNRAKAFGLSLRFKTAELDLSHKFLRLYYSAAKRADPRQFLQDFSRGTNLRVELRQMGPRDAARALGLVGPCGRPLCCRTFLLHLASVPLEFAFDQQLFVNPERLTGACGRLKCCLAYERDFYLERLQGLPEPGDRVYLRGRTGKILHHNVFFRTAQVEWSDGTRSDVPWDELLG